MNTEKITWSFTGKRHTEETKKKMSDAKKGKGMGDKNHQWGTCWIYNDSLKQCKKIIKTDIGKWINDGWFKGRIINWKRYEEKIKWELNKRDTINIPNKRLCNHCKVWKANRKFNKNQKRCIKCNKIICRDWYYSNKDKKSLYNKIHCNSDAEYSKYKDRLTIDENPRLAIDGISLEVKCRYCGKYFIPKTDQCKRRIYALNNITSENSLYCSNGCKQACPIYGMADYPKDYKQATSREVQPQLRQLVLLRDNYTCQKCNVHDNIELHCHHILPLNESPITSADVDNCITLCKECHKKAHNISGCNYYELRCSN